VLATQLAPDAGAVGDLEQPFKNANKKVAQRDKAIIMIFLKFRFIVFSNFLKLSKWMRRK
jgi:hypothetical protein